jgi:glycosyltransferase involved in cell wall biosynthesis
VKERSAAIIVLNLPVPDDRRVWAEAETLRDVGLRVWVVCPALRGHKSGWTTNGGVRIWYFPTFEGRGVLSTIGEGLWTGFAGNALGLLLLLLRRVSIVQVCNPPDSLWPLLAFSRLFNSLTVYDQHDCVPVLAQEKLPSRLLSAMFLAMERLTVGAARVIITPSTRQSARLLAKYGRRASLVRTAAPHELQRGGDGSKAGVTLGYLGVIGPQDGLHDLLSALALARDSLGGVCSVLIGGDGPALAEVIARAASLGLTDMVNFQGWITDAEMSGFIGKIDLMLVPDPPSDFNHLCAMNKVTHAMAAGLPVVYRPLAENLELTGGGGYCASDDSVQAFADAICRAVVAPVDERSAVGQALRHRFFRDHSWATHRSNYLQALRI